MTKKTKKGNNPSVSSGDDAYIKTDPRLIELVRLLARNAAERDFNKAVAAQKDT